MKEQARLNESRISYANKFGERYDNNYICKESKQGFIDLVDYANNENPYAVIYSGDIMDFYSEENYDFIKKEIAKTNAPFVYAMGNHETPVNKYIEMPGVKDASFSVLEFDDFEIVTLDNSQGQFTSSQYDKLLDETKKNKPIIIVQHVPLLTKYNETSPISSCSKYYYIDGTETAVNKKMVDLITGNENIRLVLSGHIHGSTESEIVPGKYQLTCSSGLMGNINRITVR